VLALNAGVPEVAALLKLYFRELPVPLLPVHFYSSYSQQELADDYAFVNKSKEVLSHLSRNSQKALRLVLVCLARVRERFATTTTAAAAAAAAQKRKRRLC
jgi:hypothetical protein